ncbi:hypothetical protein [Thermus phage P23-45]|nr:hypothetical protein [Thermus phage P23-45]
MESKTWTVLSLFSGAGGMDLGFTGGFTFLGKTYPRTGFKVVKAYDNNRRAVDTYNANLDPVAELKDVTTLQDHEIPSVDVVIGGFPCQDFSLAGSRHGIQVNRGRLYLALVRAIEVAKPAVFVAENVKGLLSANKGLAIKVMMDDFANAGPGYRLYAKVLNAADYGVPQKRERVFIVGVRSDLPGDFAFPLPTHANPQVAAKYGLLPWVTAKEAIGDLEDEDKLRSLPNHEYTKTKFFPYWNQERILNPNEPSPTILARGNTGLPMHYRPRQSGTLVEPVEFSPTSQTGCAVDYSSLRRLAVREAARLQSFPDDFVFYAPMSEAYRLVGNAVPPVLAWHVAMAIRSFLDTIGYGELDESAWACCLS